MEPILRPCTFRPSLTGWLTAYIPVKLFEEHRQHIAHCWLLLVLHVPHARCCSTPENNLDSVLFVTLRTRLLQTSLVAASFLTSSARLALFSLS